MRTPVRIGIIAMVANMVLNVVFVFPLMWWLNLGHVGLALATSVSAWLNALLLFRGLRRDAVLPQGSLPFKWLVQVTAATAAMLAILLWLMPDHAIGRNGCGGSGHANWGSCAVPASVSLG
ncbi:MAG: hypothetical protein CM15mP25_3060 [Gammaproteobacteria bacterium]|nr:MAG: hypothetical protein CM15mP25_3060 [Gammaproteobacteria bacterium]